MMFPKESGRKKKKGKCMNESIMHYNDGTCYMCIMLDDNYKVWPVLHKHHAIPGTSRRKLSEEYGLYVWLCPAHHEFSDNAVHANNVYLNIIKRRAQKAFENVIGSREEFMKIFGKNYL